MTLLWFLTYRLNQWLFSGLEFSTHINWIFLPAALRVAAVLLFSWRGALGLFLGAMITYSPSMGSNVMNSVAVAAVSALAPLLAVSFTSRWLKTAADLKGLNFGQLSLMCLAGAMLSAFAHTLLVVYQTGELSQFRGFFPMFAGDLLGTVLVVYAAHFAIRLWLPSNPGNKS